MEDYTSHVGTMESFSVATEWTRVVEVMRNEWLTLLIAFLLFAAVCSVLLVCIGPTAYLMVRGLALAIRILAYPIKKLSTWFYYWLTIKVEEAPVSPDVVYQFAGDPYLDCRNGRHGLYANVQLEDKLISVLIRPDWWHILPGALSQSRQECAVDFSTESQVAKCSEPSSLVVLQTTEGHNIGSAARVAYSNRSVLLTATHVLRTGRNNGDGAIWMAKHAKNTQTLKRVLLDPEWLGEFGAGCTDIDLSAINVPDQVWSLLGVGIAKVVKPSGRTACKAYGFKTGSSGWRVTSGTATAGEEPCSLVHTCSTFPGWSGTPLYTSSNTIIGVHRQSHQIGESNLATIAFPFFLKAEDSGDKSTPFKELADFEMAADVRPGVKTANIWGLGEMKYTERSFVRPGHTSALDLELRLKAKNRPLWSDMLDDLSLPEFDSSFEASSGNESLNEERGATASVAPQTPQGLVAPAPSPTKTMSKVQSTTLSPPDQLKGKQALSEELLPPVRRVQLTGSATLAPLQTTSSQGVESSLKQECRLRKLEDQLCALESALQVLNQRRCDMLKTPSPSLESSLGPSAAPQPNSPACSSKQASTSKQKRRRRSSKRVTSS